MHIGKIHPGLSWPVVLTKIWLVNITAQKMKFSIKDFFSKFDQIRSFLWIWSHLLQKSFMENFIFCAVYQAQTFYESVF